ncbi:hypothetical protein LOZ61_001452 [Ophidiomyces ophidiicola]|nr:hypothetical protein LOZ61_001452 [Ophidiomyces ophidiicola]KAI1930393.1 hypothetical protein LOZ60_000952 [Ophidiomyces ophidiicola]KAI1967254.1 hypothetical protein LOZ59_000914 [Ophidiomyces ophidiicola]KAI1975068.1 hypothetical protein LOZ56_000859 [Ophidiomyces ophidiicola]KAI2037015.1 hypothetical protein LOZ48_000673 [Ophidiomyces ophidiicola]
MFRLIPWSIGGNKAVAEEVKMLAVPQQTPSNVMGAALHKFKRKRADSSELGPARGENGVLSSIVKPECLQQHPNPTLCAPEVPHLPDTPDATPATSLALTHEEIKSSMEADYGQHDGDIAKGNSPTNDGAEDHRRSATLETMDPGALREILETQLSLEVLLKHNELRLIDQEIAKCQIALEQLRRCSEIPYPASAVIPFAQDVSKGTGFAVPLPGNIRQATSPAPWGVTNGPYSRHYARWLLPDPRFDGGDPESAVYGAGAGIPEGRATRGSWADGTPRTQRSTAGAKLQALSNGYPPPKDKAGPMIMKRKSDGKMVKLVCLDCRRDNFSSTQGFINHCRIAHNRSFASHDAAAAASGEPVEVDESGAVIGGNNETTSNSPPGFVHPLIRSARVLNSPVKDAMQKRTPVRAMRENKSTMLKLEDGSTTSVSITPQPRLRDLPTSPDFIASPQTPHLSALMQRRGVGLDLLHLVDDALTKTDLDAYLSDEEGDGDLMDVDAQPTTEAAQHQFRSTRLPARTVALSPPVPCANGRKGSDKGSRPVPSPAPLRPASGAETYEGTYVPAAAARISPRSDQSQLADGDIEMIDSHSPNNVESNQAPSLVSDDDEYEAHSESEVPNSPSASESGHDDISFGNIAVQDGFDANGDGSTASTAPVHYSEPKKRQLSAVSRPPAGSPVKPVKKGSIRRNRPNGRLDGDKKAEEQKRVTFVSPPASPIKNKKASGGKKQRKK